SHVETTQYYAKKIFSQLQAWHLILTVEQRGTNSTTDLSPKRYLYDIGIAQDVRSMPFPPLSTIGTTDAVLRNQLGGVLENFVLINLQEHHLGQATLSSWRKNQRGGAEIDFVL